MAAGFRLSAWRGRARWRRSQALILPHQRLHAGEPLLPHGDPVRGGLTVAFLAIVTALTAFDLGFLHYASDTPYSRRQSLLSKSLSYFGMESTYGCAIAIARPIISNELATLA